MEERKNVMSRKLIIEGNSVFEVDEECMLQSRVDKEADKEKGKKGANELAEYYYRLSEDVHEMK